jgi:hypothetical protein
MLYARWMKSQITSLRNSRLTRTLTSPWVIVIAALALRIALMGVGHTYRISAAKDHWRFGAEIGRIARSLAQGHGFSSPYWAPTGPTAQQPPIYPYIVAAAFKLFGVYTPAAAFAILALNSLFSALTCVFILLIGRRAFGETVGALAAWAWVFWPSAALMPIRAVWHDVRWPPHRRPPLDDAQVRAFGTDQPVVRIRGLVGDRGAQQSRRAIGVTLPARLALLAAP